MVNDTIRFLMDELSEAVDSEYSDSVNAQCVMETLSAVSGTIPETFYHLYTDHLEIDRQTMIDAFAYYTGMGQLNVECDCFDVDKPICDVYNVERNDFYDAGVASIENTVDWFNTRDRVREMKAEMV